MTGFRPVAVGETAAGERPRDACDGSAREREPELPARHAKLFDGPQREECDEREDAREAERRCRKQRSKNGVDVVAEDPPDHAPILLAAAYVGNDIFCDLRYP